VIGSSKRLLPGNIQYSQKKRKKKKERSKEEKEKKKKNADGFRHGNETNKCV